MEDKQYLKNLLDLRSTLDSRIDNEITEGALRNRKDPKKLTESLEYILEEFIRLNERWNCEKVGS